MLGTSALISLALSSGMAFAKGKPLTPGEWSLGGIQDICLESNGSWYYTTYSGLPGGWEVTGDKDVQTIIYGGTFASGAGEDSIVVGKKNFADWTEFGNSGDVLYAFNDHFKVTFISSTCDAPYHKGGHEKYPPAAGHKH